MDYGKAVVFTRPGKAEVREVRLPEIDDESVVVRTALSGVSLGTEMALYSGEGMVEANAFYPCVPGYESVGEVTQVGKDAAPDATGRKFQVGDRVMANEVRSYPGLCSAWGGHAAYAVKNPRTAPCPMDALARIPDSVSYEEAVVAYLGCVAMKGIDMVGVKPGDTVLVVGMGCVGLSALQLARIAGAAKLVAADITPSRMKTPARFTDLLLDLRLPNPKARLLDLAGGKLPDVVVECSGDPAAVNSLADFVRPGGRVHLQGQYRQPIVITRYARWNCSDLTVTCSIATNAGCKDRMLKHIADGQFDAKLHDEVMPIDDAPEAYERIDHDRYGLLKILFNWE